jgi:hypothetical protein
MLTLAQATLSVKRFVNVAEVRIALPHARNEIAIFSSSVRVCCRYRVGARIKKRIITKSAEPIDGDFGQQPVSIPGDNVPLSVSNLKIAVKGSVNPTTRKSEPVQLP